MVQCKDRDRDLLSDYERRHLAEELHDGTLQHLAALSMLLAAARTMLSHSDTGAIDRTLHRVETLIDGELDRLRSLIAELGGAPSLKLLPESHAPCSKACLDARRRAAARASEPQARENAPPMCPVVSASFTSLES